MRIMNNVSSLNAWRNLTGTDNGLAKSLERLSSGFRINRAADDVAGLAISENMRAQVRGLNQAVRNAQDGVSLVQTAEGSLNEVHSMLQRMRELAVQAANGTLQPGDRAHVQTELDNLAKEITRISNASKFNNKDLIDGSLTENGVASIFLQIGPNEGQTMTFEVGAMDAKSIGVSRDVMTAAVYDDDGGEMVTGGSVVASVEATGSVGAGLVAGDYVVRYNASNQTVQLWDAAGLNAIGTAVAASDGATVTIGDVNTAQTIKLTLGTLPGTNDDDFIKVGSRVATVDDIGGAQDVIDTTNGGTGITAVGWGLASGDYDVVVGAGPANTLTVQLFDAATNLAIGDAVNIGSDAGSTVTSVTIGDAATGRTVSLEILAGLLAANVNDSDRITVTNNGQAAENAKFDGGTKYADAQAFAGLNVSSPDGAAAALTTLDAAIEKVSAQRAQLGAIQNRLEHTINNLRVVSENLVASESRIRDVDMAMEMTQFTKNQILMQAGTAMLAQANAKNQAVLQLLQ